MGISLAQLLVVLFVILILFGAGKLPTVMGDLGKGLRAFRDEIKGDDKIENKKRTRKKK